MGVWGFHSDENDTVADIWAEIETSLLTDILSQISKLKLKDPYEHIIPLREAYARENPTKLYAAVKEAIIKYKRGKILQQTDYLVIAGIALRAARTRASDPLRGTFKSPFPKSLPDNYPAWLRKTALACLSKVSSDGWSNPQKRKVAIRNEIALFSE